MAQPVPVLLWAWCALTALAGAVRGSFEVSVLPEAPMVAYGGAVWINCSTTCPDPDARGNLETSLTKTNEKTGPGWVAFLLKNITEWVSAPQCYFTCRGRVKVVFANISAYRAPERVVLERLPELELGRAYSLTCRVLNVAPVRHLTVTLRQGGRTLHTETFQNHTRAGPDDVTVTKEITPQQRDHGQAVTCHAALDLTPHEPHFENSSSAVELKVYALPEEPQLQIFHHIEVGTKATARCEVTKVFPAAGEARFTLSFGGQSLNFTVTTSNDTATAQGEVRSLSAGERQLTCTVSVGPMSRSAGQSVLVYSLPEPILEITESQTHVNSSVTVTCRSPKADPPDVLLQLRDAKQVLVPSARAQPLVRFPLTAGEEDNGREFTCEARLASNNQAMKRTSARLTVLYGPRMDDSGCPREWTWKEGTEQTFSCQAQGNPVPAVVCKKDGVPFSIGVQQQVRREDAGTYHCEASSSYGFASRDVTVHVEYLNALLLVLVLLAVTAAATGLGVGIFLYYRSTRIRKYRLEQRQAKQAEQGKPAEQVSLNGAAQNTPEVEHRGPDSRGAQLLSGAFRPPLAAGSGGNPDSGAGQVSGTGARAPAPRRAALPPPPETKPQRRQSRARRGASSAMRPRQLRPPAPGRCLPLLLLLALPGAAERPFNVSVWPEDSVVEHGGSIWINCSTTCQDPGARGGLETSLTKAQEKRGPRWEARELVNIWEWVSAPQCYFFCYGEVTRASAHITTYRAPERVVLERLPELELGRAHNLTCRVLNVAPVRHLTVTLRQGGRTLHTETFQNRTRAAADNVTVTHKIIPQRRDHGQEVTCHSALDLRPLGQLFQNSSPAVELRVFALPEEPQLQIFHHIEVGTKATARCEVTQVFPAAGEARFTLSFGGQSLNFTVTTSNDTATAQGEVRSLSAGERRLTCTVSVGPVSRSAGQSVLVYSFPQPVLEIDQPRALVNRNVSLTCCSPASQPPGTTLQLRDSERTLASGHQPCLQLMLTARKGDNGRQFTCEGNLALGSHSFVKNTSAQLIVLYKPTLDESGCPGHQTWLEGTQQQLACEADGNPTPEVSCHKGSQVYDTGSVQNVTRGHAGVYRCSATNAHGTAGRNVTIHVEYGPEMDDAGCARTRTWVEETEQTLACLAWGNPAPAVACTKDGASYGMGVQRRVAREHAGTYHCTATNTHGSARREVTVRVEYKPSMDELSCPSAWTWVKGMPQAFSCDADGIPAPEVVCTKDGVSYRLGQRQGLTDPMGTYQCNATNPHGSATKTVTITLEYKPTMDESSCPSTRAWLEGTLHTLACEADGIPVPRVSCAKEGAAEEFGGERNVSRNDSGTYWCTAVNRYGSARRAVTVRVEYRPVVLLLDVSPSATIPRGANFNISCRAEGSPAPAYRWTVPPAPNVHCSADNSTVSVAGADRHNRGVYVCRVSNAHGQHLGRLQIQVTDNRLIVAALIAGVAVLLLGGTAGLVYYLKSTACKKGEYNVQDAESSSKATCLGRDSAVYGIQLTQT
ncbi:intercellular adhesion molecule 5 [Natator depressus]|uniref:intercellular adhesion molecule 5 n=1 Tax=Natator depressus TaxID=27790 RepID=UPI003EB6F168